MLYHISALGLFKHLWKLIMRKESRALAHLMQAGRAVTLKGPKGSWRLIKDHTPGQSCLVEAAHMRGKVKRPMGI